MTLGVKDAIWAGVTILGTLTGGVVGFYAAREGIIQAVYRVESRVQGLELRLDATALTAIGAAGFGPSPGDTVSHRR